MRWKWRVGGCGFDSRLSSLLEEAMPGEWIVLAIIVLIVAVSVIDLGRKRER